MKRQKDAGDLGDVKKLSEPDARSNEAKTIAGKTLYLKDRAWVDSEYDKEKHEDAARVKYMSEEYFKLLEDKPELGKFFALGESVTVVLEGRAYIVER